MNKIISKLVMGRVSLISFIFLCCVFTIENAFSRPRWDRENIKVMYNQSERFIIFDFLFYDYNYVNIKKAAYLLFCDFFYSEDGLHYTGLMKTETKLQMNTDQTWINFKNKKPGENIQFFRCSHPAIGSSWSDHVADINVTVQVRKVKFMLDSQWVIADKSYLRVSWHLSQSCKSIKTIKIKALWQVHEVGYDEINEVYTQDDMKFNPKLIKITPSVLKSTTGNEVKVSKDADAIIVTGAEPGENIKVYTGSGVEVKSFVANDDVVNIKLPTNQIYIVKAGQASYKVAL